MNWVKRITTITVAVGLLAAVGASVLPLVTAAHHEASTAVPRAVAVLIGTEGSSVKGVVEFTPSENGVVVKAHVTGLNPGQKHGFHIHQFGDQSGSDGKTAGGHFNPHGTDHAGPHSETRHVGDLGNVVANDKGEAHHEAVNSGLSLDMKDINSIIGRGLVIHAGTDDLKSQPTGAAGARLAVAVIGIGKAAE